MAEHLKPCSDAKVDCVCDYCGTIKNITYYTYTRSLEKYGKYICHRCSGQMRWDSSIKERQYSHYKNAVNACKKKGYVLLSKPTDVHNNNSYMRYVCPLHGEHSMKLSNLLNGKGCPECVALNNRIRFRLNTEEIVERIKECGGEILNPQDYINQSVKNLKFVCPQCGDVFTSSLAHYTQHGGMVCTNCSDNESLGAKKIRRYLEDNRIHFITEKIFVDCRDKNPLPFDFYLPDYNVAIEFDGQQHFIQSNLFPETLELIQSHDLIKNNYCAKSGIKLIRISYKEINKINKILENEIVSHKDIV